MAVVMWNLILKDFKTSWLYLLISLLAAFALFIVVLTAMLDDGGNVMAGLYLVVVIMSCMFLSLLFIKIDDIFNTDEIYASLPVNRSAIVIARYVSSVTQIILILILAATAAYPALYFQERLSDPAMQLLAEPAIWMILFVVVTLLISFTFPFYFKYGLGKGMVALMIFQFSIFGLGYFAYLMIPSDSFLHNWFDYAGDYLSTISPYWLGVAVLALIASFITGSVFLSCKFYKQFDL